MRHRGLRPVPSTSPVGVRPGQAAAALIATTLLGLGLGACAPLADYKGPGPGSPWARCASQADRGSYPGQDRPALFFYCYESP